MWEYLLFAKQWLVPVSILQHHGGATCQHCRCGSGGDSDRSTHRGTKEAPDLTPPALSAPLPASSFGFSCDDFEQMPALAFVSHLD
eukprot:CAMPEP_0172914480 /NCGR_PEP_ID=MMETSP1075-20121228/192486_1 /TAXON_ID=2916 /ORGANISM="Ceratium fusus, Strain PA161109" /LENGTH=85 /DNA_ID=CAMNT_0013773407 /DNA_START=256 /DNA_END=513 /DNA_ORIENTATION=-